MKNKQHKYILKAYTCSKFPTLVYQELSDMMLTFEMIDRMSIDLLAGKGIAAPASELLTQDEKKRISALLSNPNHTQEERDELAFFYRLTILVVYILSLYY